MADDKTKKIHWKKLLFILAGLIVLSALPLFIFRPVKQIETPPNQQERFTFMTNTPRAESDSQNLEYWEKTGNPELFAKPDSQFGYSAFLNPEVNHLRPVSSDVDHLPALPGVFTVGKIAVRGERNPKEMHAQARFPLIDTTQKYQSIFLKAPVFLLESGLVLPVTDFKQPTSDVKTLEPTLFKVTRKGADVPPEIIVERSCGDATLDNAAKRVLFQRAAIDEKISGIIRVEWLGGE